MLDPAQRFDRRGWYLCPGPLCGTGSFYSFDVDEIAEYDYSTVAAAILTVPGTHVSQDAVPDWSNWRAEWKGDGRHIAIDMFPDTDHLFNAQTEVPFWSGGELVCDCTVGDLVALLRHVRQKCPGVWLCDGGDWGDAGGSRLHSPDSFLGLTPPDV